MYKLFFLILFSVSSLVALPGDIAPRSGGATLTIGFQPKTRSFAVNYRLKGKDDCDAKKWDKCCHERFLYLDCIDRNGEGNCLPRKRSLVECSIELATSLLYSGHMQEANGVNMIRVIPKFTALSSGLELIAQVAKDIPLVTIYEFKAKQGIFLDSGTNKISFKLNDYLEKGRAIEYEKYIYQAYDCNDKTIVDKGFETFTLSKISTLEKDGLKERIQVNEIKVPFGCIGPYYTVRTVVEKTETQEPNMRTGGRNLDLATVTLKDTKQVIYIDPLKGQIINAPFIKETSVKKTSEKYKLNTSSCQYEVIKNVKDLPYHKASFSYLNNFSSSNAFTKDTVLDLQISSIKDKVIKVPLKTLKDTGRFSDSSNWVQKKSKIEKDTEVKKMLKLNAEGQARISQLKEVSDFGIAVEQVLGQDVKDTKCRIQREFYDVLENGANIIHPEISYRYKVDIYQSSKSDIRKAKKIIENMQNFSGSYSEEKEIYDGLNNPLYAPKRVEKEKRSSSENESSGILDVLVPQDDSDVMTIDDLQMFTN